jgi:anti-sigma regulatory factor (Ser/Thr protein kinase)
VAPLPSPMQHREWRLPSTDRSVVAVRRGLRTFLDEAGLPDDEICDLVLAACEAAGNAVEHAQQPVEPFIDVHSEVVDGCATIVVSDSGRWRDPLGAAHRGRGLSIMDHLADTTVTAGRGGTTVTLRTRTTRDLPSAVG